MQNQIRYSKYSEAYKETLNELDLNIFLRLFVNNRPVYGISKNHIVNALSILGKINKEDQKGDSSDVNPTISKS